MEAGHGTANPAVAALRLARPVNLGIVAVGVLVGAVVAVGTQVPLMRGAFAVAVAMLATAAGNTLNDYVDRDVDASAHPDRPIPSGDVQPSFALGLAGVEYAAAFGLAWFLPRPAFLLALLNGAVLGAYEAGLKFRGLTGNAAISYLVGSVFLFGALAVAPGQVGAALILFMLAFLANLAREVIKDVQDMDADAEERVTLPMAVGEPEATAFGALALVLGVLLSPVPLWSGFGDLYLTVVVADGLLLGAAIVAFYDPGGASTLIKVGMLAGIVAFLLGGLGPF